MKTKLHLVLLVLVGLVVSYLQRAKLLVVDIMFLEHNSVVITNSRLTNAHSLWYCCSARQ